MSEFSTTRLADFTTATTGNASLAPAILKLKSISPAGRLSDIELYETLQSAVANGFAVTYIGVSIP